MSKLTKKERDTGIYYNLSNVSMQIHANDPKLNSLAFGFPELCMFTEADEYSGSYFEVDKQWVSIHVTSFHSEECRQRQSRLAKKTASG